MRALPRVAVASAAAVLLTAGPAAGPAGAVDEVVLSGPPSITHGQSAVFEGAVDGGAGCTGGRSVNLMARPAGSPGFTQVATTSTAGDGTFALTRQPGHTTTFRAQVPAEGACGAAASADVSVAVRASVSLDSPARLPAGRCTKVAVTVRPAKPGHVAVVQRRTSAGWIDMASGTLSAGSSAGVKVCPKWAQLGSIRIRGSWPSQDDMNADGAGGATPVAVPKSRWMKRIDSLAGKGVGISVRDSGAFLYRKADGRRRAPASNQKLLLSMALLDALGPGARLRTRAAGKVSGGIVTGDLWILGSGDPGVGRGRMRALAKRLADAGIRRVRGRVMGSTGYFRRDWRAPGWKPYFARTLVALPTALTFEGNTSGGRHIRDPEARAAGELTDRLRKLGITVRGKPGAGRRPGGLSTIAEVRSPRLSSLLGTMNRSSINFNAEVLGKLLGASRRGAPGTIAKGARSIEAWAAAAGVKLVAHDGSGLSYRNRVSPKGLARLLGVADGLPWGEALREALPAGGQGTLSSRLREVPVRAKTGTLSGISALSGFVQLRSGSWAEFSILSGGMSKSRSVAIEDAVVRILSRRAA